MGAITLKLGGTRMFFPVSLRLLSRCTTSEIVFEKVNQSGLMSKHTFEFPSDFVVLAGVTCRIILTFLLHLFYIETKK